MRYVRLLCKGMLITKGMERTKEGCTVTGDDSYFVRAFQESRPLFGASTAPPLRIKCC
jgi:hypothetical protein